MTHFIHGHRADWVAAIGYKAALLLMLENAGVMFVDFYFEMNLSVKLNITEHGLLLFASPVTNYIAQLNFGVAQYVN